MITEKDSPKTEQLIHEICLTTYRHRVIAIMAGYGHNDDGEFWPIFDRFEDRGKDEKLSAFQGMSNVRLFNKKNKDEILNEGKWVHHAEIAMLAIPKDNLRIMAVTDRFAGNPMFPVEDGESIFNTFYELKTF